MTTTYSRLKKQFHLCGFVTRPEVILQRITVFFMAVILTACGVSIPKLSSLSAGSDYALPTVTDSDNAATIYVSSQDNLSDTQFIHLLKVDGTTIMKLKEGDRKNFQIDAGSYEIESTCHNVPDPDISPFPVNLSVVDGRKTIELIAEAGDELCLRLTKPLLNCVDIEETSMSQCQ